MLLLMDNYKKHLCTFFGFCLYFCCLVLVAMVFPQDFPKDLSIKQFAQNCDANFLKVMIQMNLNDATRKKKTYHKVSILTYQRSF